MSAAPAPRRAEFRFFEPLATRWSDLDAIGHVNNARFFTYDEQARINYMRDRLGGDPKYSRGGHFILASASCDFLAQLHHPSNLELGLRIARIGESSLQTLGAHFVGEKCYAVTRAVIVWFDYARQVKGRVPEAVRRAIFDFEVVKPDGVAP